MANSYTNASFIVPRSGEQAQQAINTSAVMAGGFDGLSCCHDQDIDTASRYYYAELTEMNGEHEYPSKFLMRCTGSQSPDERINQILFELRDGAEWDDEGDFLWYGDGTSAKNPHHQEITALEYSVMKAYLTTL